MAAVSSLLGSPALLPTGLSDGVAAKVFAASSRLPPGVKERALALADAALHSEPEHLAELHHKRHAQLQLKQLMRSEPGTRLAALLQAAILRPFVAAGMRIAALEVVCSRGNTLPKPLSRGSVIRGKLRCQHQDVRAHEPWMDAPAFKELPGALRLVADLNLAGQRWFEFRLLERDSADGSLRMQERPLLEVSTDLVAFDRLAAGSGGFGSPGGSRIFHARRTNAPGCLGVADVVVTAGLEGGAEAWHCATPTAAFFAVGGGD